MLSYIPSFYIKVQYKIGLDSTNFLDTLYIYDMYDKCVYPNYCLIQRIFLRNTAILLLENQNIQIEREREKGKEKERVCVREREKERDRD